ncbi:rCG54082, isoform CRA_c [Rattus norvegicus]|uniref:RCG54082, isoform CRA_c n=1 Tax=Rattus norvegicus TaxID=10116 RepID=A6J945_RAT|nr:rCG54082, isoform CRA_c [Rattus norvegicus]
MAIPARLPRGQRTVAGVGDGRAVLPILLRVSGTQAPHQPSGSVGVRAALAVVPGSGGERAWQPRSSSNSSNRSRAGRPQKAR